jgi:heme/copper-type cytochrome/quinol oxidase subunit 3
VSDYLAGGVRERAVPRGSGVGIWGMAMLVAAEVTLFGTFIGSYYYLRFSDAQWPPPGTPEPRVVVPLVMAGILATSSLPMHFAASAARRGGLWSTRALLVWALAVQCGYLVWAVHDYTEQLQRSTPQDDAYGSIYYTLLGADHAHIAIGALLVIWLLWKLLRGLTAYRVNAVRAVALYWHAVNVLTLIVTGVLLSATL